MPSTPRSCSTSTWADHQQGEDLVADLVGTGASVVVVTGTDDLGRIATATHRSAAGFVHKSDGFQALVKAITRVLAGEEPTVPAALRRLRKLADAGTAEQHRKLERFERLSAGMTVNEVSKLDHVAVATVRSQVRAILIKLGVNSQVEAVALAYRPRRTGRAAVHR